MTIDELVDFGLMETRAKAAEAECERLLSELRRAKAAMETAMQRFNLMAGVGLVNGACPKVGRQELRDAVKRLESFA